MAITPSDDVKDAPEPLPRGPLVEQGGQLSRSFFNWFQGKDRKLGEIISGVNLNRQNIVQLQTDYQAADGSLSSAYIAADAVVAADAESARATLSTTLTAAFQAADAGLQTQINNRATITQLNTVETTLTGSIATVSSNLSAETTARTNADTALQTDINTRATNTRVDTVESNAASALASSVSSLTAAYQAADATLQSDINTRATSAALTSESSARASGDSANATSITNLTASVSNPRANLIPNSTGADGLKGWSGGQLANNSAFVGWQVSQFTTGLQNISTPRGKVSPGAGYVASVSIFASTISGGVFAAVQWRNASGTFLSETSFTAGADGRYSSPQLTAPAGAALANIKVSANILTGGLLNVWQAKLERNSVATTWRDDAHLATVSASVTNIAEAYATDTSSTARLVWTVNTATNVATIEQTAHEGYSDGTWNGSAIKLSADLLELLAKDINFGTNTSFEDTYGTIYTEKNSKRMRILGPFPASDDIVMWFGPTSVALNSETKTNGHFSMATDGKVYLGAAALGSPITISRTNGFVRTRIGAGTITSDSVSFSSTGGSGSGYTYAHELFSSYSTGPTLSISSSSGSPITASAASAVPGDEIRGFVQTTVTDSDGNKATLLSPVALFCES